MKIRDIYLQVSCLLGIAFCLVSAICYPPYGCFTNEFPFNHTLITIPEAPSVVKPSYKLRTRTGELTFKGDERFSILCKFRDMVHMTRHKPVKFIIHGLLENTEKDWLSEMSSAILKREDAAVMIVDWERGANTFLAPGNARLVGAQIAYIIENIVRLGGGSALDFHLIGFSLGAHVAGYCGKGLQERGMTLGRITGLDVGDLPRGFIYEIADTGARLHHTDARFVDVIHTDMDGFGIDKPIGHLDFYPNGGKEQPGCQWTFELFKASSFDLARSFACDHMRSVQYYIETMQRPECDFRSYLCDSEERFNTGSCDRCNSKICPEMGYFADQTENYTQFIGKKLYLRTRERSPFCILERPNKRDVGKQKKEVTFDLLNPSTWFVDWG